MKASNSGTSSKRIIFYKKQQHSMLSRVTWASLKLCTCCSKDRVSHIFVVH